MSLPLKTIAERPSTQSTLRDSISIPENAPGVNAVYNIMTNAHISKTELQRNKIICEGKIEAYVLYLTNSPENPIYSIKKEIPFSYMIECKNETNTHQCEIKSTIKHASYNINANGEIDIRCLLSIDCILMKEFEINNIVDINISETEKQQGMLIYFASEGEEIWEISKRYGVPCKVLADHNGVESEKLHNRCKLFIPMR